MRKTHKGIAWVLVSVVLLVLLFVFIAPSEHLTADTLSRDFATESIPALVNAQTSTFQKGLVEENGVYRFYNEYGDLFTGGYKEVSGKDVTDYYYFLPNGQAFTTGYKTVQIDGVTHYFYFGVDGKAFTGGLKEISFGEESYYYYFQADGKALTGDWGTFGEKRYYFQDNGRAAQSTFTTIDGNRYYFDETGSMITGGWFYLDDCYYYADETGALAVNTVADGYKTDADGKAPTKNRILALVNEHTDETMTDQEKIDAFYNWLWTNDMKYRSSYEHIQPGWDWPDAWVDDFAVSMIDNWGGNCFKFASLLGLMIREATGLPVIVYHGNLPEGDPHGWLTVYQDGAWYAYDVQQAIQGLDASVCYKVPYPASHFHNAVGTDLF